MPIIIVKTTNSPIWQSWSRPHGVWQGSYKSAVEYCERKTNHPNNHRIIYEAVKVKNIKEYNE